MALATLLSLLLPLATATPALGSAAVQSSRPACTHCSLQLQPLHLLRLRGGVRELEDRDDWEALQEEAGDRLLVVGTRTHARTRRATLATTS